MSVAEGTRRSRPGELHRRRVVLLAESAGLATLLIHLLDPADRLSRIGSLRELAESRALDSADVVVLDLPTEDRAGAVGQVRRRFLGSLIVLVANGEDTDGLRLDDACALLTRPFSAGELAAAMAVPALIAPPGTDAPAENPEPSADVGARATDLKAAAREAPFRPVPAVPPGRPTMIDRAERLLVTLTEGWKARRRVRVAGFSFFVLMAFTAAFALAAQEGRCGPGCDAFGTVLLPEPTVAPASSRAPSTTGPKRSTTTVDRPGSQGSGVFGGVVGSQRTPATTGRMATTTTRKPSSGGGGPGSTTPTTRPTTTALPTTTTTEPPTTTTTTITVP